MSLHISKDPYFSNFLGVCRLVDQYKKHKNLIVAFDFDDTIYDFHKKGYEYPKVVNLLKKCSDLGFSMILFTASEDLHECKHYCQDLEIRVDAVNENVSQINTKSVKPYYNILLDDKAGLEQAYKILEEAVKVIEVSSLFKDAGHVEKLSEFIHDLWCEWAMTLLETESISIDRYCRWQKCIGSYADLSEDEKDKDREIARKLLDLMKESKI